ncbi:MAG: hypothetical protein WA989_17665, partial [Henriciella sp.]
MILQRLATSIRKQDWVTVAIETLIVVLGVFLGIQLGNWNAARASHQLGEDYVERLTEDLRRDRYGARHIADYYREVMVAVIETDRLLSTENPDPRELVINAYRATEIAQWPQSRSTWEQIVSSGHLGLLPQGSTMDALNLYFGYNQSQASYLVMENSEYRKTARSVIPIQIQEEIRAGCSDVLDEVGTPTGFADPCVVNVPPEAFASAAQLLKSDIRIRETLGYQYSELSTALNNLTATVDYIDGALEALADEDGLQ